MYLAVDDDLPREGASIQVKIVIAQAVLERDHGIWETARHVRYSSTAVEIRNPKCSRRGQTKEFQYTPVANLHRELELCSGPRNSHTAHTGRAQS